MPKQANAELREWPSILNKHWKRTGTERTMSPALLLNFQRLGLYHAFITHLLLRVPVTGEGTCWHTQQGHFLFFSWCLWAELCQRFCQTCSVGMTLVRTRGGKAQGQNVFLSNILVQWYSLDTKASPTHRKMSLFLRHAWPSVRVCD